MPVGISWLVLLTETVPDFAPTVAVFNARLCKLPASVESAVPLALPESDPDELTL